MTLRGVIDKDHLFSLSPIKRMGVKDHKRVFESKEKNSSSQTTL